MDNRKKTAADDEEYQLPTDEYINPSEQEAATAPSFQDGGDSAGTAAPIVPLNKRVVSIVVLAVVALIFFHWFHSRDRAEMLAARAATAPSVTVAPAQSQINAQVLEELDGLKQKQSIQQDVASGLQDQFQQLQNAQKAMQHNQEQLVQALKTLSEQVQALSSKPSAASTGKLTAVKPAKPLAPAAPPLVFHVKAMVPGRAWIVGSDGSSTTVVIGDEVPQYGLVRALDVGLGQIQTSSGKIITYGPNDH